MTDSHLAGLMRNHVYSPIGQLYGFSAKSVEDKIGSLLTYLGQLIFSITFVKTDSTHSLLFATSSFILKSNVILNCSLPSYKSVHHEFLGWLLWFVFAECTEIKNLRRTYYITHLKFRLMLKILHLSYLKFPKISFY